MYCGMPKDTSLDEATSKNQASSLSRYRVTLVSEGISQSVSQQKILQNCYYFYFYYFNIVAILEVFQVILKGTIRLGYI